MLYFILIGFTAAIWAFLFFGMPLIIGGIVPTTLKSGASIGAAALALIITISSSYYGVDTGNIGVARSFGAVDTSRIYAEGPHWLLPWQTMFRTDNRTAQTALASPAESASKDLQIVHTNISLNWHIQPDMMPMVLKDNGLANDGGSGLLTDKVLVPAILETFKAVISQYIDAKGQCVKVVNFKNGDKFSCLDVDSTLRKYNTVKGKV